MKCPKCYYQLVLRENSRKYKCPVCKKRFPQKELELNEFLENNKKEKEKDKGELQKEIETRIQKLMIEISITLAFNSIIRECNKKQSALFNRVLDRDLYNKKKYEYWAKNKIYFQEKRKENYNLQKSKILGQQKVYRQNNKLLRQINHLRTRQKELTLKYLENGTFKPLTFEFEDTLPTFCYR